MIVSTRLVGVKVASLSRDLQENMKLAQKFSARQFIKQHCFVHRIGMQISQRDPRELEQTAAELMEMACPMVTGTGRDKDFIISMDQSPIPFNFNRQRTLEFVGAHAVHIHKLTGDTKQATLSIPIKLIPILVFEGKPDGFIAKQNFATSTCGCIYACQKAA